MSGRLEDEFDFQEDENDHFQALQSDVIDNLELANTASILALNALGLLENQPSINSTQVGSRKIAHNGDQVPALAGLQPGHSEIILLVKIDDSFEDAFQGSFFQH